MKSGQKPTFSYQEDNPKWWYTYGDGTFSPFSSIYLAECNQNDSLGLNTLLVAFNMWIPSIYLIQAHGLIKHLYAGLRWRWNKNPSDTKPHRSYFIHTKTTYWLEVEMTERNTLQPLLSNQNKEREIGSLKKNLRMNRWNVVNIGAPMPEVFEMVGPYESRLMNQRSPYS